MPLSCLPPSRRAFVADTTALVLFFTATGIVNERFVAGMVWEEVLHARLLGAALMVPVGRPYGLWRDRLMRHAPPGRLCRNFFGTASRWSASRCRSMRRSSRVSGASGRGLFLGGVGATVMMLALGRPYGVFLNRVRALFGLPAGGMRPMRLDGRSEDPETPARTPARDRGGR